MPRINVNLADVQTYEAPAHGEYEAEIKSTTLIPATQEGKFDQLKVSYTIIDDGPELGSVASEWLSFSPKAAFRMKKWFDKFGYGDLEDMDFDDDSDEMTDPDIVGARVVIRSYEERDNRPGHKEETRDRVALVEVLDEIDEPAPKQKLKAVKVEAVPADADDAEEEDEDEEPAPRARREAPKVAATKTRRTLR